MEWSRSQKVAYTIVAVLAVVFLLVLIVLQAQRGEGTSAPTTSVPKAVQGLQPGVAAKAFEVGILSDERYKALDKSLFEAGRVPVPVPAGRGKPSLF